MARIHLFEEKRNYPISKLNENCKLEEFDLFGLKKKFQKKNKRKNALSKGKENRKGIYKDLVSGLKGGDITLSFSLDNVYQMNDPKKMKVFGAEADALKTYWGTTDKKGKNLRIYNPPCYCVVDFKTNTFYFGLLKDGKEIIKEFPMDDDEYDIQDYFEDFLDCPMTEDAPVDTYKEKIYWASVGDKWVWIPKCKEGVAEIQKALIECKKDGILISKKKKEPEKKPTKKPVKKPATAGSSKDQAGTNGDAPPPVSREAGSNLLSALNAAGSGPVDEAGSKKPLNPKSIKLSNFVPCLPPKVQESKNPGNKVAMYEYTGKQIVESSTGKAAVDVYAIVEKFEDGSKKVSKLSYDISKSVGDPISEGLTRAILKNKVLKENNLNVVWEK